MTNRRRRVSWTIGIALAIGLAWIGAHVDRRLSAAETASESAALDREHEREVYRVRPSVVRRVADMRAVLADDDRAEVGPVGDASSGPDLARLAPWVGEYAWHWREYSTCGSYRAKSYQEHVLITDDGRVAWWFGEGDARSADSVDAGEIVQVEEDHVRVRWLVNGRSPHRLRNEFAHEALLDERLVRLRDGGDEYVMPAVRVPFLALGQDARCRYPLALAPRRGGWNGVARNLDEQRIPAIALPDAWREWVLPAAFEGDATIAEGPMWIAGGDGPPRFWRVFRSRPSRYGSTWSWTLTANVGSRDGVRAGMFVELPFGKPGSARVTEVSESTCRVDAWAHLGPVAPDPFASGSVRLRAIRSDVTSRVATSADLRR